MSHFSPADRRRLAAVLELLSSDKAGERQAAAEAAHRLVRQSGARWADVLTDNPEAPWLRVQRRQTRVEGFPYARWPDWRAAAAACRQHRDLFTQWEADFLESLARFPRISTKQSAVLHRLAGRLDRVLSGYGE